jgi:formylmethanofuran dehydrogenase subunit E
VQKTILKRRSAKAPKIHEKMFNIFSHQENANQNGIDSNQNTNHQENIQQQMLLRILEEKEPHWWEYKKISMEVPQKTKTRVAT